MLDHDFYNRYTPTVARDLLGCFWVRECRGKIFRGMITETEAYRGFHDLGSHAAKGKTERNAVMFGPAGRVYVYLIYGMYWMLNIVTEKEGYPAAVLIRGVEPVIKSKVHKVSKVALDGPGKVTRFLQIDKALNGHDVTLGEKLWIERPKQLPRRKIIASPRIGIDYAKHARHWKWNFKLDAS